MPRPPIFSKEQGDNRPLAEATVVFTPEQGGQASRGATDDTGRYELRYLRSAHGAIVGRHCPAFG